MESKRTAAEAIRVLDEAEDARNSLAQRIVVPSWFFTALAGAIAVQIATTAVGLGDERPWLLAGGLLVFAAVAGVQLARFRSANGVWLGGLASRVVLGTATSASIAYVVALGVAIWAAYRDLPWLVAVSALLGGGAYALSGRRWLSSYRTRPSAHARGESVAVLAAMAVVAVAGLVVLVIGR